MRPSSAFLVVVAWCLAAQALAYDGRIHQDLTFLAAKHFNRCAARTEIPSLTPLQIRYLAKTNVGLADRNAFARMFNWRYYDRGAEAEHSVMWAIDTRFHEHFNEILARIDKADSMGRLYSEVGRIINYVQLVSSPPHTVPVFTSRFWRFSFSDRFDGYPVDVEAVAQAIGDDCSFLAAEQEYASVLRAVATDTIEAVRAPIEGLPTTWEAFWKLAEDPENFGEYGPAGNTFGRKTEFRCAQRQRCVLLRDDPLYATFAAERHAAAVKGTLAAMLIVQRAQVETEVAHAE
ncbi:MAG: hypothetical protein GWM88_03650 [Pseudomonadales bacterium]|nr:hypothetical protein [Pseudomonadales bacterium]NIX07163.1 hypothetical protein [Pseudomonadales bacterium]